MWVWINWLGAGWRMISVCLRIHSYAHIAQTPRRYPWRKGIRVEMYEKACFYPLLMKMRFLEDLVIKEIKSYGDITHEFGRHIERLNLIESPMLPELRKLLWEVPELQLANSKTTGTGHRHSICVFADCARTKASGNYGQGRVFFGSQLQM